MRRAVALVAILAAGTLAGCFGDEAPQDPVATATDRAVSELGPGFFMFWHGGGALRLALESGDGAVFTLFDGGDVRIGRAEFRRDGFSDEVTLPAAPAGDHVLWVEQLDGRLAIDSGGVPVAVLRQLASHVERHVLAATPMAEPLLGFVPPAPTEAGQPVDVEVPLQLLRPATGAHLLGAGQGERVSVHVTGAAGTMYSTDISFFSTRSGPQVSMQPLSGTFDPAASAANVTASVHADALAGTLLLEAFSYSRVVRPQAPAEPFMPPSGGPSVQLSNDENGQSVSYSSGSGNNDDPLFVYGELPEEPVAFSVSADAAHLILLVGPKDCKDCEQEAPEDGSPGEPRHGGTASTVRLFDAKDRMVGLYRLGAETAYRIPITAGGEYVAFATGSVTLAADAVPKSFGLKVLETDSTILVQEAVGRRGDYHQVRHDITLNGVPFAVHPDRIDAPQGGTLDDLLFGRPCTEAGFVRLIAGNETIGYWSSVMDPAQHDAASAQAQLLLPASSRLSFIQGGMGGECGQLTARVFTYVR